MKTKANLCLRMLHGLILCFIVLPLLAQESNVLDKRIRLPKSKGSIYQLLKLVTDRSDHLFIYDSKVVYNEQKGKYFRWFTIANVGYLAVLLVVYGLIRWM